MSAEPDYRVEAAVPRAGEPEATLVHFNVPLTEPDLDEVLRDRAPGTGLSP